MQLTDESTVEKLGCLAPIFDSTIIRDRMVKHEIFPLIEQEDVRVQVLARILQVQGLIPTLHSFFEDLKYLEPCAKIMESLVGPNKKKKSIFQNLVREQKSCRLHAQA
jgi:hypothetical protein